MGFSSMPFLVLFLPLSFLLYWGCRHNTRLQRIMIIISGLVFYGSFDWKYDLILLACVVLTFYAARSAKKEVIVLGVCVNFLSLSFFKFGGTAIGSIVLPVGMSFYVFQATGYLFDVMRGKERPEKDFLNLATFLCFFPVLVAGPILRYGKMKPQITSERHLSFYDFQKAVVLFLWGTFMKMVIADRIKVMVDNIFGTYRSYGGIILFIGAVLYSIQIYTDFAGYSYIAVALATAFGFSIPENFRQPYFAVSISDFWHRWHISLSQWLRDYIYIPLGGNRKGLFRQSINIIITFLASGIWHGTGLNYVVWGLLHGFAQIAELFGHRVRKLFGEHNTDLHKVSCRIMQSIVVFLVVTVFWIFFRADNLFTALSYIKHMLLVHMPWQITDGTIYSLGVDQSHLNAVVFFIVILIIVSILREKGFTCDSYLSQNVLVKCAGVYLLIMVTVLFGYYGPEFNVSSFIYGSF